MFNRRYFSLPVLRGIFDNSKINDFSLGHLKKFQICCLLSLWYYSDVLKIIKLPKLLNPCKDQIYMMYLVEFLAHVKHHINKKTCPFIFFSSYSSDYYCYLWCSALTKIYLSEAACFFTLLILLCIHFFFLNLWF